MSEKRKFIAVILGVILFFSYVFVNAQKKNEKYNKELLEMELEGVVLGLGYHNKANYISCMDGSIIRFNINWSIIEMDKYNGLELIEFISIGDSIIKNKNSRTLKLKSNKSGLTFNIYI